MERQEKGFSSRRWWAIGLDHLLVTAWEGLPITSRAATAAPTLCLLTFFRRYLLSDGSFCLSLTLHCILFSYILPFQKRKAWKNEPRQAYINPWIPSVAIRLEKNVKRGNSLGLERVKFPIVFKGKKKKTFQLSYQIKDIFKHQR